MQSRGNIDEAAIRSELKRILLSPAFEKAKRSQRLLTYLVESALAVPPVSPKEYVIAVDVFDRSPDYDPSVDATVRVEAGRLRSRLRDYYTGAGLGSGIVFTIPKGGYAVAFSQQERSSPAQSAHVAAPPEPPATLGALTTFNSPAQARARFGSPVLSRLLIPFVCLGILLAGLNILHQRSIRAGSSIRSMAVLPLRDLSGSADAGYLAEGMTDELNTELARIPHLRVISHDSVAREQLNRKPLAEIAKDLNVDTVVEGTIVRAGDTIRINAQLTDLRDNRQLWASSVEGQAKDLITLEANVAQEIASHARLAFVPFPPPAVPLSEHPSPQAYEAYLRGRYFLDRRDAPRSTQYFQRSIDLDPRFASAYAGLAEALAAALTTGSAKPEEATARALTAAQKAIKLDPRNGPAYSALGTIEFTQLWDWSHAEQDLLRGIQLTPEDSYPVTMYGLFLDSRNRPAEALAQMQRASIMDPLSFYVSRNLGAALFFARRYDEAIQQLNRAKELQPERSQIVDNWISWIYQVRGMHEDAVRYDLASLHRGRPDQNIAALLHTYQTRGWNAYWRSRLQSESSDSRRDCSAYQQGLDYLYMGNNSRAVTQFQQATDDRCYWMEMVAADPRFDPLRANPRFQAIIAQINSGR